MDKFVKLMKRKEDNGDDNTDKFYVPRGKWIASNDDDLACALDAQQPPAPQKIERSASPPSPISSVSPTSMDFSRKSSGQMRRNCVSRRLLFDDEEKVSVNKPVDEQMIIITQSIDSMEDKATPKVNPDQTIIDSLSARGFVVNDHSPCKNKDRFPGQYGYCMSARPDPQTNTAVGEHVPASLPSACRQFKCLSVFEGIEYSVLVADAGPAADVSAETAKVLAAVGPHPHVVSYFCNWSDARYHYLQMELCPASLSSVPLNNVADCRTVLEHVSCALHYLHDGKMYAHNRVDRPNVFTATDGDRVVYKLGGFEAATKLSADDIATASADVQSLCLMVSGLIKDVDDQWFADKEDLRQYLSSVTETACSAAAANALSVWRWCRGARPQLRRSGSMSAMMTYQDVDDVAGVAGQTAVATSFSKTAARRAYEIAAASASGK
ncbi:Wee1-like protein kinase [Aphis craccivora]|uniref:Wee1-like protein kinase n=1 Tax=Aphis craccivora TaxID=307492 RepID=A0A6G0YGH4_APHCR|nr:Wee1-like protein kinase [Aphis craccivora]